MKVSNPDKMMFPEAGITKGELVAHYERVAGRMVPLLAGRPLTLQRFPDGIARPGFMQKNAADYFPDLVHRVEVPKREGVVRHPVVVDRSGLLYLANQGTVTFHAWTSRVPRLDQPDQMIFDLDPPEGDTQAARLAVRAVRDLLAELGVPSFPVATGSKGYHAVVPLRPSLPIERVEEVSRRLAALVVASHPDRLTLEFRIERREGRVFVDWLRNRYSATTVVPYSLRPRPGATVAVPIAWEELDEIEPDGCDLAGMTRRLEETDPWEDLEAAAVDLKVVAEEVAGRVAAAGIRLEPFDRFRS